MKSLRWIISRPDVDVHAGLAWFASQSPAMKQTVLQDRLANYADANKVAGELTRHSWLKQPI